LLPRFSQHLKQSVTSLFSPSGEELYTKVRKTKNQFQKVARPDVPIRIRRRIVHIPIEETIIRTIVQVATNMEGLLCIIPYITTHNYQKPFILLGIVHPQSPKDYGLPKRRDPMLQSALEGAPTTSQKKKPSLEPLLK